jgi:hypothetical protein
LYQLVASVLTGAFGNGYLEYYIDPETGLPHIYDHNVNENKVEEVLTKPGEDRQGYEGARIAIGQTEE